MHLCRFLAPTLACVFATCAAPAVLAQQANKPVALISISPLDKTMKDTTYLLKACGIPEMGGIASMMVDTYTSGLDRSRPIGATVSLQGQMPSALIFLPLEDRELFFGALLNLAIEPDDLGDGLYEIFAQGQTIYAKEAGDWLFVAQTEDAFGNLPANPAAMLGNLPEKYDVAMRINLQALPSELKSMMTEQMRIGFENGLAEQPGQTPEEAEMAREMGEASIEQMEQLMNDTEQIIIGWAIDSQNQKVFLDGGVQFAAGTKLAKQADDAKNQKSDYTGFILPGASAKFRFSSSIADSDKALAKNNLRNSMKQVEGQMAQADMPDEARDILEGILEGVISVTEATIDDGTFDGAGSVSVTGNKLRVLIGGRVADGAQLAQVFKDAAAKIPGGNAPVEFDYETYKGVTLHRAVIPVPSADPAAAQVFGDAAKITIGTSAKGFLVALDPDGDKAVKATIDRMESTKGVDVPPFDAAIKMTPILEFAQSIAPNPMLDNVIQTMSSYSDKDKVEVNGSVIPRGGVYRLTIEEGVLRSIGSATRGGGGGGF